MGGRPVARTPAVTSESSSASAEPASSRDYFVTTRWTVVLAAGRESSPDSEQALAELCQTYWYPLYAYARRRTSSREEAEDLVQAFFEKFLAKNYLAGLDSARGRFRAFLLASLKHFLVNEWEKARRQKRGGGVPLLSLDWERAGERYHAEPADPRTPDHLFDREWALALLDRVIARLEAECRAAGKGRLFESAKVFLTLGAGAIPYAKAAADLGLEEGALRVATHRLRKRYRELLRDEIAQTLSDPAAVEEELRSLRAALSG